MTSTAAHFTALVRHPQSHNRAVHAIDISVFWIDKRWLLFAYVLKAKMANLRIPAPRHPRRAEGLWKHTCFEAFIAAKGSLNYYEFNFSPSGEWAAYSFCSYREGGPIDDDALAPEMSIRSAGTTLELNAIIRLDRLVSLQPNALFRLGLSAVIEDVEGQRSYWALKHPPGKPDFHHPDSFLIEIRVPGDSS
jgi:hypothetical protein